MRKTRRHGDAKTRRRGDTETRRGNPCLRVSPLPSPRPLHRVSASSGFTLLEMLAATAMTALLAASLYASFSIAFSARKTAVSAVATVRQFSQTLEVIKADLQSAVVPNGILAGSFVGATGASAFQQEGDSLVFYSTASDIPSGPGTGDIKKIEYACVSSPDLKEVWLVRRVTTNLLAQTTPDPNEEPLCRGVKGFFLRYYDGTAWQENWDSTTLGNVLPLAVALTIQVRGEKPEDTRGASLLLPIPCGQAVDPNLAGTTSSGMTGLPGTGGG